MKKQILLITVLITGCQSLVVSNIHAQISTNAQGVSQSGIVSNAPPGIASPFPGFKTAPQHQSFRQAIMALRRAKLELANSKDTFNGHQQPAINACDKAIQELEAAVRTSATSPSFAPQFVHPAPVKPVQQ